MFGNDQEQGVLFRAMDKLYRLAAVETHLAQGKVARRDLKARVTFVEIYNEKFYDLFHHDKQSAPKEIHYFSNRHILHGVQEHVCHDM